MFFRVGPGAEADVGEISADQGNKVAGVAEAVRTGHEFGLSLGRVAAQGHDVAEAVCMVSGHDVEEFGFGRSDASEVRHDEPSEVVAQNFGVFEGALAGCPAGAVGDGDEVRMVGAQGFGRAEELFAALFILGREKFHGEKRAVLRDEVGDGPVWLHGQK